MSVWSRKTSTASHSNALQGSRKGKLIPMKRALLSESKSLFIRMIEDCRRLGATEIFIGSDRSQSFQFNVGGETYSGLLPDGTRERLERMSCQDFPISLDWDELDVENLKLGITTTGNNPVYCFSWREKVEGVTRTKDCKIQTFVDEPATDNPLVLIVDDDPRFSQILSRVLGEQNFDTLTAINGNEGLSILEEFNPALIITDIHMPHLSGPELLLETRKRGYEMPCLVLTNDEDALAEAELVLLGATAFIKKSEDPRVLLAWCRRLTSLRRVA